MRLRQLDKFDLHVGPSGSGRLLPVAVESNSVAPDRRLAGGIVGEHWGSLVRIVEVERLGGAVSRVVEVAQYLERGDGQTLRQPPPLPAVACQNGTLRLPVLVLVFDERVSDEAQEFKIPSTKLSHAMKAIETDLSGSTYCVYRHAR